MEMQQWAPFALPSGMENTTILSHIAPDFSNRAQPIKTNFTGELRRWFRFTCGKRFETQKMAN
jgi:hypothetical protein